MPGTPLRSAFESTMAWLEYMRIISRLSATYIRAGVNFTFRIW